MSVSRGIDVRGRALQAGELAAWLSEHSLGNRFGLAVDVGTELSDQSRAVAVAIVAADGDGRYIDPTALTPDDEAALASWLADPGPPKAVHGARLAMHALAGRGWSLRGVTSDTLLAAHLLRPDRRGSALNDLLLRHMRCALPAEAVRPGQLAVQGLILQACAVLDLADVLDEELARIDSSSLLGRVELPVQRVLAGLETVGIATDRALLTSVGGQETRAADLLNSIAADGRIHAILHQAGTTTGRLTSSDPNLDELGSLRDAFIAGDGYVELMTASYDELKLRISAHLTGDAALIEAGCNNEDLRGVVEDARRAGYAATLVGRRCYLADLDSSDRQARADAERTALAMSIEGSAADIVKTAMISIDQTIKAIGLKSRMVLAMDDVLIFEVVDGEQDVLASHVQEQMRNAHPLDVALDVSVGFGPSWGCAAH